MTKKQITEVIKAMMYAAELMPLFDDDYYENLNGTSISRFLEGVVSYFDLPRDCWAVRYGNISYMDTPSETLSFFQENIIDLMNIKKV